MYIIRYRKVNPRKKRVWKIWHRYGIQQASTIPNRFPNRFDMQSILDLDAVLFYLMIECRCQYSAGVD